METAHTVTIQMSSQALKVDGSDPVYGDWRDDLARDGFAVVKEAVPRTKAENYADAMYGWLEGLYVSMHLVFGWLLTPLEASWVSTETIDRPSTEITYRTSQRRACVFSTH